MGLAAPKQRMKLSKDPNNTKWTSDTSSFGHKIMASQGWKPGEYLGAVDAPHAEFHTAANASHIRVSIKDDNLGLGAKVGSGVGHGECTGLDAFKNLLGRLNGKDEDEIEKEQKSREELKRAIYTERRWGSIRFVQGGFLVGDKIQNLIDGEVERLRKLAAGEGTSSEEDSSDSTDTDEEPNPVVEKTKRSKKRKLEEVDDVPEVDAVKVKKSKKEKRKSKIKPVKAMDVTEAAGEGQQKKSKRKREDRVGFEDEEESAARKQRRKEKKLKKEKREKKGKSKTTSEDDSRKESKKQLKRDKKKREAEATSESEETTQATTKETTPATPVDSGRSTPIMMQGRHAVRARNIAQKRLASMDVASLNQIFMIKSQT